MVDLSLLNAVTVDPTARRARVGGGALLADMDAATQAHGLAAPAGMVSHTGVGGLTLGGGMGWLTRKFGLSIDNLVSAEVVTADGRVLQAAEDDQPDLFWAIRGGGGNFGVVTSFEFRLHEVDPMVQFGLFFWSLDQGPEALRLAREITAAMPPDINAVFGGLNAPPAPFVPEQHHFAPGYVLLLTGFGSSAQEHAQLVTQIRESVPPLFDLVTPMPYVELQKLLDEGFAFGFYGYEKGTYTEDLPDAVIEVVTEHVPRRKSPMSALLVYRLDGAYSLVGDDETAFSGGRSPRYGSSSSATRRTPICSPRIAAGSATSGRRCARTPLAAGTVTSTPRPITRTTGSAEATAQPSTHGWPGSRPYTTRTTRSATMPTSCRRDIGRT